ncbi:MAG: hypothetical protein GX445_04085 [Elusimicrobia bacterium]|jgi:hypothetical protein|nr:hypothetical protein [Elusimicrobiota bacterium]
MECGFKEKVIMFFYNELKDDDGEIRSHIESCDECKNLYNSLDMIENKLFVGGFIYENVEKNIMVYAKSKLKRVSLKISNILIPLGFSFSVLLLFFLPQKTFVSENNIDLELTNLESSVAIANYDLEDYIDYGF